MTIAIDLNARQLSDLLADNRTAAVRLVQAARPTVQVDRDFVFFAAFDGTNNDMNDLAGDAQCTNVGQLWRQFEAVIGAQPNLGGQYYPGLGTRGQPTAETWLPSAVTEQVRKTAEQAYGDFKDQATLWLRDHPTGQACAVIVGFSRGCAAAAVFAQRVQQAGLPTAARTLPPGSVPVAAGVLFDPVATGMAGNLALPPCAGNVVVAKALNEYRHLFKAVRYTGQADIAATIGFYGNHCDVGGGYDNGLAAVTLAAATDFLQHAGLPIGPVPAERRLEVAVVTVHSEEYDRIADDAHKRWDVYNEYGFSFSDGRLFDDRVVVVPASPDLGDGLRRFTTNDGRLLALPANP